MELTPIRVKGKAGPKRALHSSGPPHRAVKRPRDAAADDDEGSDGSRRKPFQSSSPAAPIEELPTEILERIIFLAGNLNFLRSSLRLGYRFSAPSFLTELLGAAFAPTWDAFFGHPRELINTDLRIYFLTTDHTERMLGDPSFQVCTLPPFRILPTADPFPERRPRLPLGYHRCDP
jgi:hypothetical protein